MILKIFSIVLLVACALALVTLYPERGGAHWIGFTMLTGAALALLFERHP